MLRLTRLLRNARETRQFPPKKIVRFSFSSKAARSPSSSYTNEKPTICKQVFFFLFFFFFIDLFSLNVEIEIMILIARTYTLLISFIFFFFFSPPRLREPFSISSKRYLSFHSVVIEQVKFVQTT